MVDIIALDDEGKIIENVTIENLFDDQVKWFWVDFNHPTEDEIMLLSDTFYFHHLAIEDCLQFLQRPKVDFYEDYYFFVFHALTDDVAAEVEEINLFLGDKYVVTFHSKEDILEIQEIKDQLQKMTVPWKKANVYISYLILDNIVDHYFPYVYAIEDELDKFENLTYPGLSRNLIDVLYNIRGDLLRLRRTINSMRDLVYRINNSNHLKGILENELYYVDIHDHLLKLSEMVEANRDLTSDIRDNYMSLNANRMNTIMTILTIITAIFIPITFIAGVYGMNFTYMPEIEWRYGYFIIMGIMVGIAVGMFLWFKRKGWFNL